ISHTSARRQLRTGALGNAPERANHVGVSVKDLLKGKKVDILAADMFERVELEEQRTALEDAGAEVEIVSIQDGEIQGFDHFDPAQTVKVDRRVDEVSPGDYDALLVPGGVGNPD